VIAGLWFTVPVLEFNNLTNVTGKVMKAFSTQVTEFEGGFCGKKGATRNRRLRGFESQKVEVMRSGAALCLWLFTALNFVDWRPSTPRARSLGPDLIVCP
jgi:hypothetical protein